MTFFKYPKREYPFCRAEVLSECCSELLCSCCTSAENTFQILTSGDDGAGRPVGSGRVLSPSQIPAGLWYAPVWLASSVRSHNAPSVTEDVHAEQLFREVFHSVLWFPFLNKDFEGNDCSSKVTLEEVKRNFLWTIGGAATQVCFICCVTKAFLILPVAVVNGVMSFHLIMV